MPTHTYIRAALLTIKKEDAVAAATPWGSLEERLQAVIGLKILDAEMSFLIIKNCSVSLTPPKPWFFNISLCSSRRASFFFNFRSYICLGVMGDAFGILPLRSFFEFFRPCDGVGKICWFDNQEPYSHRMAS